MLNPRQSGRFIATNCEEVTISSEAVRTLAVKLCSTFLNDHKATFDIWHECVVHPKMRDDRALVDWCFTVSALNFSFWSTDGVYAHEHEGVELTGYLAFCAVLNQRLAEGAALTTPSEVIKMTYEHFSTYLTSNRGCQLAMLKERWAILRECCETLIEKFQGTFYQCLIQSRNSAMRLLQLVQEHFPSFRDYGVYKGREVSFLKRAQILVADIYHCLKGRKPAAFDDVDSLTMFADYRIPQLLHHVHVLEYSANLRGLLEAQHLFKPGDEREMAIRGCSIEAVQQICETVNRLLMEKKESKRVNAVLIDYYLWTYASENKDKINALPHHRVRSTFY